MVRRDFQSCANDFPAAEASWSVQSSSRRRSSCARGLRRCSCSPRSRPTIHKAGARERLPALYGGAGLAVLASLFAAWMFEVFNNGVHNDLLEGVTILAAAALMRYVSGWLILRQDPRAWQHFLNTKADAALARRTHIAIAVLAFRAVFREGAETVLFVHALAQTEGGWNFGIVAGLVFAALVLVSSSSSSTS
jgi:FTR1 family protein